MGLGKKKQAILQGPLSVLSVNLTSGL